MGTRTWSRKGVLTAAGRRRQAQQQAASGGVAVNQNPLSVVDYTPSNALLPIFGTTSSDRNMAERTFGKLNLDPTNPTDVALVSNALMGGDDTEISYEIESSLAGGRNEIRARSFFGNAQGDFYSLNPTQPGDVPNLQPVFNVSTLIAGEPQKRRTLLQSQFSTVSSVNTPLTQDVFDKLVDHQIQAAKALATRTKQKVDVEFGMRLSATNMQSILVMANNPKITFPVPKQIQAKLKKMGFTPAQVQDVATLTQTPQGRAAFTDVVQNFYGPDNPWPLPLMASVTVKK